MPNKHRSYLNNLRLGLLLAGPILSGRHACDIGSHSSLTQIQTNRHKFCCEDGCLKSKRQQPALRPPQYNNANTNLQRKAGSSLDGLPRCKTLDLDPFLRVSNIVVVSPGGIRGSISRNVPAMHTFHNNIRGANNNKNTNSS